MTNLISSVAAGLIVLSSTLVHAAVAPAKVVELAAHRLDRLVVTKKIDPGFSKNLRNITVKIDATKPPVYFMVTATQSTPAKGTPLQLDISFDQNGRPLAFKQRAGGTPGTDAGWNKASAITLMENGLHHALDMRTDAKVKPYYDSLKSATLTNGSLNGKQVAQVQLATTTATGKMNVYLNLDGSFVSMEILP